MSRSCFVFLAFLSSSILSLQGFSTSRLLSSSSLKKNCCRRGYQQKSLTTPQQRCFDEGIVLLRVATDTTTVTTTADEDSERSYDFISVEEAQDALRRERSRYEGERSELQHLLDIQHQQLKDLTEGRRDDKVKNGGKNRGDSDRNRGDNEISTTRMVIHGTHAHVDVSAIDNHKNNRKKGSVRHNMNDNGDTFLRMERLEAILQDAMVDNEELTIRLRDQHHQYNLERTEYEDELREERDRLNCVRDELHMERAYFETSRRMLEGLLEEEQQKVQELEQELLMMITQEQVFFQHKRSQEQYQEQQRQEQAQKQQQEQHQHMYRNINSGNRQQQQERAMGGDRIGFIMNINDVQCPLYP